MYVTSIYSRNLSHNKFSNLDSSDFAHLHSLRHLKLHNNKLRSIVNIGLCQNLTSLILHHNDIRDLSKLALHNYPALEILDLGSNKISHIPVNTFHNGSMIKNLLLNNNKLEKLDKSFLDNLQELESLKINRNRLNYVSTEFFINLKKLKTLELNKNNLSNIDGLTFKHLAKLKVLKLKRNGLASLQDGAFFGLENVTALHLDQNRLSKVRKGWLFGLKKMESLTLSQNDIVEIHEDAWSEVPSLKTLYDPFTIYRDLSFNKLETIRKETFEKLNSIMNLYLENNSISFLEDQALINLKALEVLELKNNAISWSIEDTNGAFVGLDKLRRLGLHANKIYSIARRAFVGLSSLTDLDLSNNPITSVQENVFEVVPQLRYLSFNTTNLLCDCELGWLPNWLIQTGFQYVINAQCNYPVSLKMKSIFSLSPSDFTCDDHPKTYITQQPNSQVTLKGDNVSLICKAESSSNSPVNYKWRKDYMLLPNASVINFAKAKEGDITEYTTILKLSTIQYKDEGIYQCIFSNHFGSTYSKKATINVHVFPKFTKAPNDMTIKAGTTLTLVCAATGSPAPQIAWKKDGGNDFPAARERRMHVLPQDDRFFIVNVQSIDAGEYSCTASNIVGSIVTNSTITVLEIPSFVKPMEDEETKVSETTVLECMASGSPKPDLIWRKDGEIIGSNERRFFSAGNQLLIIVETQLEDAGTYTCEMSNTLGNHKGSAMLTVIPYETSGGKTVIGIVIIVVVCCVVGTSIIWVFIIYHSKKRQIDYNSASTNDDSTEESPFPAPYHPVPAAFCGTGEDYKTNPMYLDSNSETSFSKDSGTCSGKRSNDDLVAIEVNKEPYDRHGSNANICDKQLAEQLQPVSWSLRTRSADELMNSDFSSAQISAAKLSHEPENSVYLPKHPHHFSTFPRNIVGHNSNQVTKLNNENPHRLSQPCREVQNDSGTSFSTDDEENVHSSYKDYINHVQEERSLSSSLSSCDKQSSQISSTKNEIIPCTVLPYNLENIKDYNVSAFCCVLGSNTTPVSYIDSTKRYLYRRVAEHAGFTTLGFTTLPEPVTHGDEDDELDLFIARRYDFVMPLRSILKEFINHVEGLENRRLLGDNLYDREFQKLKELTDRLKHDPGYACKAGQLETNRRKNRYKDILPYDRTRVVLQENNSDPDSDYINASYVKGSSGSMAYIAAQGPLPQTVNDFWRMVWQCEVQVVVMACNEREGGKAKCDYYWPAVGEKKIYYDIAIQTVKVKPVCEDFLVRTWKLVRGNEQRTVCQFHYMTWPDHGIPSSVNPILHMIRMIRNCQATETIPVLVHCSAGCGRTGTFCAIDQVWGLLRSGKLLSMFSLYKMVAEMRYQRVAMVQTKEQYMLVHRAVATLFQQQLCIIDSHPYQNINRLGQPIGPVVDDHIYENVDSLQSDEKNEHFETAIVKPPAHRPPRLETPPSSETETDQSSEEFEAYQARYRQVVPNLTETKQQRSVTLLPRCADSTENPTLPSKRRSQTLVTLQEEENIKKLLSDLNNASDNGPSTYKPRYNRTGSQDDINVTYSPERSFVYISDSDDSDSDMNYKHEVARKPSIAKLKALFEKTDFKIDLLSPSPSPTRREITRSHSQRVTRSNATCFGGQSFNIPVMKSDSFNVFDRKEVKKPILHPKGVCLNVSGRVPMNSNSNMVSLSNGRSNLSSIENKTPNEQNLDEQNVPEKPRLPIKQRKILKPRAPEPNACFYTDNEIVHVASDNVEPTFRRSRNRSNEFTSTGTRKPPVLPRKKYIGGRATAVSPSCSPDDKSYKIVDPSVDNNVKNAIQNLNEICATSEVDINCHDCSNDDSKSMIEAEAERFHGSGGSVFYGSCDLTVSDSSKTKASKSPTEEKFEIPVKSSYTNVSPHAKQNIEQIESSIDQCPRGAIIDLTSTKTVDQNYVAQQLPENIVESKSTDSESGSQSVSFDVILPPKKPNNGYEPIWLGPGQKLLTTSFNATCDKKEQKASLIRENNYGKISPRCRSEDKLLECANQSLSDILSGAGYGRIVFKSSSEPPISVSLLNANAIDNDSTTQTSDSLNSSDSSGDLSKLHKNYNPATPNLLIHSPLTLRKAQSDAVSSNLIRKPTEMGHANKINCSKSSGAAEPEFNSAVAEIRNLIDELMFDSSGSMVKEQPRRERCHSLDILCDDVSGQADIRERRPSTDLLDVNKQCIDIERNVSKTDDSTITKPAPADNSMPKQTVHNIPPVSLLLNPVMHYNSVSDSSDMEKFCSSNSSCLSTGNNLQCSSVYYSAEDGSDVQKKKVNKPGNESTWTPSNWSEQIVEPPSDADYKALSSTVLRNNSAINQRIYDNPSDLLQPEVPPHGSKKSRTNITRSVSARETNRPRVVKRHTERSTASDRIASMATMRPHHISSTPSAKSKHSHQVVAESNCELGKDDGYVTLAETASTFMNNRNQLKVIDSRLGVSTEPQDIPPKSPVQQNESHLYASIQNYPDSNQNNRTEHLIYRTLPQPPPPPPEHPPPPVKILPNEHIYSLPTLPKYRPPPPPPQQKNPDLPTPPPSSEETSSSSSQSDTRPEPLYSQIQKPKREPSHFKLSENFISTGYGHIQSKTSQFSHDDLDVHNKPVAPPRKGRKQHKYARHSLLDLESQKLTWNEDFQGEKSSPQWYIHQKSIQNELNSEIEENAPNIPQKTAAAFQVPDDIETEEGSDDSPSSSVSLNSSVGSGTNIKLDDSHGSSILSRSISKAFGKLNLLNRVTENVHSRTSPRVVRKSAEIPIKGQHTTGMGFPNRINKYPQGSRPVPSSWKS
ncbi:Leucine-rich repeats and immunoglobulin-like domains protein 3 [Nymphon striatum]|nr:Leucine-rich repeats and immunoglobulin-like domains protein 3 [Nymphon striatum]